MHCPIIMGSLPLWTISSHVSKRMAMVAYHLPRLARSPDSALALITMAPSLKSVQSISLLLHSQTRRRLIHLPLLTRTRNSDTPCILYLSLSMTIVVLTTESMSCRRNPTTLLQMDNFKPSSNFLTLVISVAT